ncbi:hypothetical protein DL769_004559 [Monosporascus sp. CRB-8-3]|nr:hypothetical protein DL769_004559 [Monosporascus sp. CRB-8-3]
MYNLTKALLDAILLTLLLNPLVLTAPLEAPRPTRSPMEREATMMPPNHEKGLDRSAVGVAENGAAAFNEEVMVVT